jgi:TonB family protein
MFETSVVESRSVAGQRHFGFLSLSIVGHSAVLAAFVVASLQSSEFPTNPPDEVRFFHLIAPVTVPPPLGKLRQPANEPADPGRLKPAPRTPLLDVAPTRIPTDIAPVEPSGASGDPIVAEGGGEGVFGDPNGVAGGVDLGRPAGAGEPGDVIHQPGGEVRAPVVIRRVDPEYPRIAIVSRKSGVVRLRCIIGKDGRIRDPEILFSSFNAFNQPALDAVRQWMFSPGVLHGQPVDTWFELTVTFTVR